MAQKRIKSSRFAGVYWRESSTRKHKGRADKCFDFCVKEGRSLRWITVGWLSEGITEQSAAKEREAYKQRTIPSEEAYPVLPVKRGITLNEAMDFYLEWLSVESKYAHLERHRYDVNIRKQWGSITLDEMKSLHVQRIKGELLLKMASGSALRLLSTCRAAVNYSIKQEIWEGINPFGRDRLSMPRPQNKGERFLVPEEARKLLTELEKRSPQLHDMAWLSLKTGLRSTEIFRLQGGDVDLAASVLWITEKGGKRRALCVANDILEKLASYERKQDEYIFQDRQGGKMTHISDTFERVCVSLGWNPGNAEERASMDPRKKVWFHTLRHTFASWLAQSGKVTLYELRDLMRHKTINMTERYAHLIPAQTFQKAVVIDEVLFRA